MASFTDQKQRVATEKDCKAPWSGGKDGKYFRCYLCGYKFVVGDKWRWIFAGRIPLLNFIVCEKCDGDDVLERWQKANEEAESRFWWLHR